MKITKRHNLTKQAAKDKLERALPGLTIRFGDSASELKHTWEGDTARFSFRARGFEVTAELVVSDTDVVLDVRLPLAARLFEGTIRPNVEQELENILNAGSD